MHIDRVDNERDFARLRREWDDLLASSRQNSPFLRHDQLSAWWGAFGDGARLHVLTCRDGDGSLLGVLPTYTARQGRLVPIRAVRFLGDQGIACNGLSPFALPEAEDEVFERLLRHLHMNGREWDVLDLNYMEPGGGFFERVIAPGAARVHEVSDLCPRIALPEDWDSYLRTMKQAARGNVRRSQKRLEEHGLELEVIRDADELPGALADFKALHEERRRHSEPSYEMRPAYVAFLSRMMPILLAEDRLRLMFLRQGERRLAANYVHRYDDTMYGELSGISDDEAAHDVLRALIGTGIRMAIEEGCTTFDMLNGLQDHKSKWAVTDVRRLSRAQVYGVTVAGLARRGRDTVVERLGRERMAAVPEFCF